MKAADTHKVAYILAGAAAAGIFVLDLFTPLGVAVWLGYILVPVVFYRVLPWYSFYPLSVVCTALIVLGFMYPPRGIHTTITIVNHLAAVYGLWITAFILVRRKKAEERLRASEAKYRIVADNTYDWEFWLGPEGRFVYSSPSCRRVTGYTSAEFEADPGLLARIVHPDDLQVFSEHDEKADGPASSVEYRVRRKDGSVRWIEHQCMPVRDENGGFLGRRGSNRDVTERKYHERQKADLYAMIVHDLKSPLAAIMGYSELILDSGPGRLDEDARNMVATISNSGGKLLGMVEDFLALSRMESGNLDLELRLEDVREVLREPLEEVAVLAGQKGLCIQTQFREDVPEIALDRKLVQRAVTNLLRNAVRYTPSGGEVTLRVERGADANGDCIVVSVADNGPGIPKEEQDKVFDKYYRSSHVSGVMGTGLGLAVVKAAAEAHGGRVEVQSETGKGSTFMLFLPAVPGNA